MAEIFRGDFTGIPAGGKCAETDPEIFYPTAGRPNPIAVRVCRELCQVRVECLEGALDREEPFGIWGGLGKGEREKLLRKRKAS